MKTAARVLTALLMSWLLIVSSVPVCCRSATDASLSSVPSRSAHHGAVQLLPAGGEPHAHHRERADLVRGEVAYDPARDGTLPVQFTRPAEDCSSPVVIALAPSNLSQTHQSARATGVTAVLHHCAARVSAHAIPVEDGAPPGESHSSFDSAFLRPLRI